MQRSGERSGRERNTGGGTVRRESAVRGKKKGGRGAHRHLFPALCTAVFLLCMALYIPQVLAHRSGEQTYEHLVRETIRIPERKEQEPDGQDEETAAAGLPAEADDADDADDKDSLFPALAIDYEKLEEINPDFVGVLYLPVLDICYPVVQGEDNEEYLTKDFTGAANVNGAVFLDCRSAADFTDRGTFLFAHNMASGAMFGKLKTFLWDDTLADRDPYFYLYSAQAVRRYRIIGYAAVPFEDVLYDISRDFESGEGYRDLIGRIREISPYHPEKGVPDLSDRPPVVTLSTCYGTGHRYSFAVFGVCAGVEDRGHEYGAAGDG